MALFELVPGLLPAGFFTVGDPVELVAPAAVEVPGVAICALPDADELFPVGLEFPKEPFVVDVDLFIMLREVPCLARLFVFPDCCCTPMFEF